MTETNSDEKFWTADRQHVAMMLAGPFLPLILAALAMFGMLHLPGWGWVCVVLVGPLAGLGAAVRLMCSWQVSVGMKGLAFSFAIMNGLVVYLLYHFTLG